MDILGVGPLEFVFVIVIMLLVLGPKGMVKAVHDVGQFLRKMVQSPVWKSIINSSQEIRQVQTQIIKESGLDESIKEIRDSTKSINQVTNSLVRPTLEQAKIDPISMKVPEAPTIPKTVVPEVPATEPAVEQQVQPTVDPDIATETATDSGQVETIS
jgi:Sec-independent protein translocase protein TatA